MRFRLLIVGLIAAASGTFFSAQAANPGVLAFGPVTKVEFRPANGETYAIPFVLGEPGEATLELYTGDGDMVRRFGPQMLKAGRHEWVWDGRDANGILVPDEAYHPVLVCNCESGRKSLDSRQATGGRPLSDLDVAMGSDGTIQYRLPESARVLVRVGIKGGAMLRALDSWSPHTAGLVRQSWNGTDASGKNRILEHPRLAILVRAFNLPDHTIITSGNGEITYREYREQKGWPPPQVSFDSIRFERAGKRLTRESQLPVSLLRDPRATIEIVDGVQSERGGLPVVPGSAVFRVNMPPEDRWLMQQSLYEVGFFLDYRFVSEEETGYTPLSWRWAGDAKPGIHTMTVNISGLWGQVGVATLKFRVPARDQLDGEESSD